MKLIINATLNIDVKGFDLLSEEARSAYSDMMLAYIRDTLDADDNDDVSLEVIE